MLVDSSVWIAYLRGDDLVEVAMLTEALEHKESVWLTATILQEVLQGADCPERFTRWDRVLGELPSINSPDAREAARSAAHLYARCRWAGVTPRSVNDCLIATHAIFARIPLLHRDRDFELIAGVEPKLMLVPAKHRHGPDGVHRFKSTADFIPTSNTCSYDGSREIGSGGRLLQTLSTTDGPTASLPAVWRKVGRGPRGLSQPRPARRPRRLLVHLDQLGNFPHVTHLGQSIDRRTQATAPGPCRAIGGHAFFANEA